MSEPFDPYRDWLGISGGRAAANYYLLFGLPLFTSDLPAITAAADQTIARVRQLQPGDRAELQQRLLKQLAMARGCLLDPAARARYDAALKKSTAAAAEKPAPVLKAIPVSPQPAAQVSTQSSPLAELFTETSRRPRKLASSVTHTGLVGKVITAALLFTAVVAGGAYWLWGRGHSEQTVVAEGQPTMAAVSEAPVASATSGNTALDAARVEPARKPADVAAVPAAGKIVKVNSAPPPGEASTPTPKPDQSGAKVTGQRQQAFRRALNQLRRALAARDLESSACYLTLAEKNVATSSERDQLRRFEVLAEQLMRFFGAVQIGWKKFEPLDVLQVGDETIVIAGIDADGIRVRDEGQVRTYTRATLPPALLLVIAKAGLDENSPAGKLCYGAFHAVDPKGDRPTARRLWQAAAAEGQDTGDLLPLLDEHTLEIEREPVPAAEVLQAAESKLKDRFGPAIAAASKPAHKSDVGAELLSAARDAQDTAEQYWLLDAAREQCVTGGDALTALAAIDELAVWFQVDPLALKAQALDGSLQATVGAASTKDLGELALKLSAEANAASRADLSHQFAETALAAGRKVRDRDLIEQARKLLGTDRGGKKISPKAAPNSR